MPPRVVIIGAGLSGLRTAERLRRLGYGDALVLIGSESHLPYDRPPLSKSLLAGDERPALPVLRAAERFGELDLDLRLGVRVTGLDTAARVIHLDSPCDGTQEAVPYDQLVLATGLEARTLPAWAHVAGVHTLRTFDDCVALHEAASGATHATVIGAGVLGSEIAATLRVRGLGVDLVDPLPQPLCRVVGEEIGALVADLHREHGVELHLGATVTGLAQNGTGAVTEVALDDGTTWTTDIVVVAVGGTPNTSWLDGSGIALDNGVVVDQYGATSVPRVWAVGDVASIADPRGSGQVRLEHWTSAGDLANTVATNVAAALGVGESKAHAEVPYVWSDQYGLKLQCLGLPRAGDEVVVLAGGLEERTFLAAHVLDGRVHAVTGLGMPGQLMRCRAAVAVAAPLEELQATAPWERKKVTA